MFYRTAIPAVSVQVLPPNKTLFYKKDDSNDSISRGEESDLYRQLQHTINGSR